jgi:hypothetical protein
VAALESSKVELEAPTNKDKSSKVPGKNKHRNDYAQRIHNRSRSPTRRDIDIIDNQSRDYRKHHTRRPRDLHNTSSNKATHSISCGRPHTRAHSTTNHAQGSSSSHNEYANSSINGNFARPNDNRDQAHYDKSGTGPHSESAYSGYSRNHNEPSRNVYDNTNDYDHNHFDNMSYNSNNYHQPYNADYENAFFNRDQNNSNQPRHQPRYRSRSPLRCNRSTAGSANLGHRQHDSAAFGESSNYDYQRPVQYLSSIIGASVNQRLRHTIESNVYFEFSELLPMYREHKQEDLILVIDKNNTPVFKKPKQSDYMSFSEWQEAFDIFVSIKVEFAPLQEVVSLIKDLLTYKRSICNMKSMGYQWANYDRHFRKELENHYCSWATNKPDLLMLYSKPSPTTDTSYAKQNKVTKVNGWCRAFNSDKGCTRQYCRYSHFCSSCGKPHSVRFCKQSEFKHVGNPSPAQHPNLNLLKILPKPNADNSKK